MAEETKRSTTRSPAYPTIDIDQAIGYLRRLHAKDRWIPIPLELASKHLGYAGLSGQPRAIFATMKQYGLIAYKTEGESTLLVMSDLAKKALGNLRDEDLDEAKVLALDHPRTYQEIKKVFEGWDQLPSSERLAAMLEMKYGFNPAAAATFDRVLRRNLALVNWRGGESRELEGNESEEPVEVRRMAGPPEPEFAQTASTPSVVVAGLQQLIMPGHRVYLAIPEKIDADEARRILTWLKVVVDPTVRFAGNLLDEA